MNWTIENKIMRSAEDAWGFLLLSFFLVCGWIFPKRTIISVFLDMQLWHLRLSHQAVWHRPVLLSS